jgi:hypothetical protein
MSDKKHNKTENVKIKNTKSLMKTHITTNYINYLLLLGGLTCIGYLSPSGIPRAIGTGLFMYIFTFIAHRALTILKPIMDFITKAGKTIFINNEIIHLFVSTTSMSWVFIFNYLFYRLSDIKILDPYTILFWILMYSSIHVVNFMLLRTSEGGSREITELLNIFTGNNTTGNVSKMGYPKINIIASVGIILTLISIILSHPKLLSIPESHLTEFETIIVAKLWK